MIPAAFDYVRPHSLDRAVNLLAEEPRARPLAGGQSLLTQLKLRTLAPPLVVDLGGLAALHEITVEDDIVRIGAMVRVAEFGTNERLREHLPLFETALAHVADVQVRNRSTLGGTLAYADPSGDLCGVALAASSSVVLTGPKGERVIPLTELFTGAFGTSITPDELLTEIRIPSHRGHRAAYYPIARRPADPTLSGVAFCASAAADESWTDIGLGLIGMSDRPMSAPTVAAKLEGRPIGDTELDEACAELMSLLEPLPSTAASARYRRAVAPTALVRAVAQAGQR